MKKTESDKAAEFKSWKASLQCMPYETEADKEYYCKVILTHLDKILLNRNNNLNIYFDCKNQINDRWRLHKALCYIESADLLSGKRIIFDERNFETCIFHVERKIKVKNNG